MRYIAPDGKERSESFDRKPDAERFMVATAAKVQAGTWSDPALGRVTLRRYVEDTYLPAQLSEASTRESMEIRFRLHILPAVGDRTLGQLAVAPSVIRAWAAGLQGELSDGYVRTLFANLSGVLQAAVTDGKISRNPCNLVRPPRASAARVQPWTSGQAAAVRDALPERYAALADLGAGLGLRQGEAFGLAAEDVDFLRRVVHVRRQVRIVAAQLVFAPPKGGKERDVPLPDSVALRLSAHIAAFPPVTASLPWKVPGGKPVTARLLFTSRESKPLNRNYINSYVWKPALKAAGLPQERENGFHALRHHFASVLLANGVDIRALASYLGHTDPGFTLRTYVHLMPDAADRMRSAVDRVLATGGADGPATAQGAAQ